MKRFIIIISFVAIAAITVVTCNATETLTVTSEGDITDYVSEYEKVLPDGTGDIDSVVDTLKNTLSDALSFGQTRLCVLFGVLILSAAVTSLAKNERTESAVNFAFGAVVCIYSLKSGLVDLELGKRMIGDLSDISTALLPVEAALAVSGQKPISAVAAGFSLKVVVTVCEYLFSKAVMPLICCAAALIATSPTSSRTLGVSSFFGKLSSLITVCAMSITGIFLSLRSTVASVEDSVAVRGIKFAVGSFVPVVGGALSEAVGYVGGSLSYVKSTCGIAAICALLAVILPVIIKTAVSYVVFLIAKAASDIAAVPLSNLYSSLLSVSSSLFALEVACGVLFVLRIALFIKS